MNKNVPVLNLTDEARQMIAYSCGHTGVLFDMVNNKQALLQGHVRFFFFLSAFAIWLSISRCEPCGDAMYFRRAIQSAVPHAAQINGGSQQLTRDQIPWWLCGTLTPGRSKWRDLVRDCPHWPNSFYNNIFTSSLDLHVQVDFFQNSRADHIWCQSRGWYCGHGHNSECKIHCHPELQRTASQTFWTQKACSVFWFCPSRFSFNNRVVTFCLQVLSIWDWTTEAEIPLCTAELDPRYGVQNYVLFNPEDTRQLVSNSESQVIFYSWVSPLGFTTNWCRWKKPWFGTFFWSFVLYRSSPVRKVERLTTMLRLWLMRIFTKLLADTVSPYFWAIPRAHWPQRHLATWLCGTQTSLLPKVCCPL